MEKIEKTNQDYKKELSPELYKVAREGATEAPFSENYYKLSKEEGVFKCSVCGNPLFSSEARFESGTGWPSFYEPINSDSVEYHEDNSFGMRRTEITCGKCGSHLGHVFDDGPKEKTGKRYCINCVSLNPEKN